MNASDLNGYPDIGQGHGDDRAPGGTEAGARKFFSFRESDEVDYWTASRTRAEDR